MRRIKALLPRSLFGRALLILVTPLVLVQIVAAAVFFDRVWETVTRRISNALAGEVAILIETMARYPSPADRSWALDATRRNTGMLIGYEPDARLQGATRLEPDFGLLENRLINAINRRLREPYTLDFWNHPTDVLLAIQLDHGTLRVAASRDRLVTETVNIFLIWMIGTSVIAFTIASLFMRNQVRPIRRLAHAAEEFGKGRDVADFKPAGATEVRQAAAAFIVMRERLRRFLSQRTEMLAGVSHDLRTPLTRMKLELAMLGDQPLIAGLKTDVAEMERMVDSYLAFARGEGEEQPEPVDLGPILNEVVTTARRTKPDVTLATEGDLVVSARPQTIKRCLDNLVSNAARHGKVVALRAVRRTRWIEVTIDDDGPGVPAARREDVFKPFVRLDAARTAGSGGVGLGLTIARDAVRSHGGDVALEDSPLGGLRARVTLPV
ncbi:MAG: HAMP domain-containing protein [Alphaproteobacteria bacterium]|nr:HAMP domain-containing protein [Alphaproteobacteria bacterium]